MNPYLRLMRLHQPVGIWLLMWPCWWSVTLFSGIARWDILLAFALGAAVMRSAGCIINDLWDRKIDAQVERTRARPLASGELRPAQAFALLALLLCVALGIAAYLGPRVVAWSAAALPLVIAYPLMKRLTWWPQAFLGLTFNWGALLGSVAVTGEIRPAALAVYAAGFFWTLGYDTVYALQDREDDRLIGIRSTALFFGEKWLRWTAGFYTASVFCLLMAGFISGLPLHGSLPAVAASIIFYFQINKLRNFGATAARSVFLCNQYAGGWVWIGWVING